MAGPQGEGGGMSTSAGSFSGEGVQLLEASLAAVSSLLFSLLWADLISAFSKAAHISSDHARQLLHGLVLVQNMPTPWRQVWQDG